MYNLAASGKSALSPMTDTPPPPPQTKSPDSEAKHSLETNLTDSLSVVKVYVCVCVVHERKTLPPVLSF